MFDFERNDIFGREANWHREKTQNPNRTKVNRQVFQIERNRLNSIQVWALVGEDVVGQNVEPGELRRSVKVKVKRT